MTLYDLTADMNELLLMLEQLPEGEAEDIATQEQAIKDTLEMVQMDFADKADGYGKVLRQLEAEAAAVKEEKMRLSRIQTGLEKNIERLKGALQRALITTGQKSLKTELFTFSTRASQVVKIDAESIYELPDDMIRYADPEPDKKAIKDYLKENPECSWAHLEENISLIVR